MINAKGFLILLLVSGLGLLSFTSKNPHNYLEPDGPYYYSNDYFNPQADCSDLLTVASYNIKHSENIVAAIDILQSHQMLETADILLLQEMDESGTKQIAHALGLNYIYYPINRAKDGVKEFGNSILVKDNIVHHSKLVLPHGQTHNNRHRAITNAAIQVNGKLINISSAHMATVVMSDNNRKEQVTKLCASLDDKTTSQWSIVGGDFNTFREDFRAHVSHQMEEIGYSSSTLGLGSTHDGILPFLESEMDIIFARSMKLINKGVVRNNAGSDHYPIWATFRLEE